MILSKNILKFSEFIKESESSLSEYNIDKRYYWSEEIGNLIDEIIKTSSSLKDQYNYNVHSGYGDNTGFEFDIKSRKWPDADRLTKKYGITEESLNDYWWGFIEDSLQYTGDDIIENSKFFTEWSQTGRSGGWLVLNINNDIISDTEQVINDSVADLNYYTESVDDEDFEKWNELRTVGKSGFRLLQRDDIIDDFENIDDAEKESKEVKTKLQGFISELALLEEELKGINKRIREFWEKSLEYFEEELNYIILGDD